MSHTEQTHRVAVANVIYVSVFEQRAGVDWRAPKPAAERPKGSQK